MINKNRQSCCSLRRFAILPGFFLGVCLGLPVTGAAAEEAVYRFVQVREASVREQPRVWARLIRSVPYGERVRVEKYSDHWYRLPGKDSVSGYLHESALTPKKIVLKGTRGTFEDDVDEVDLILAGRGFTEEVEDHFAANTEGLRYEAVDRMEARRVSETELRQFRREGKLE